jgi:hypothetical protein
LRGTPAENQEKLMEEQEKKDQQRDDVVEIKDLPATDVQEVKGGLQGQFIPKK